mgnify:CR=1 FL=1
MECPKFGVDKLKEEILLAAKKGRRGLPVDDAIPTPSNEGMLRLSRLKTGFDHLLERKDSYKLDDLTQFYGTSFLRNSYRALLGREPDEEGQKGYLEALRTGKINKVDVLARLNFSAEGQLQRVRVHGLWGRALIRKFERIPLFGYLIRLITSTLRLPKLSQELQKLEFFFSEQIISITNYLNQGVDESANFRSALKARLERLEADRQRLEGEVAQLQRKLNSVCETSEVLRSELYRLEQSLDRLRSAIEDERTERRELTDHINSIIARFEQIQRGMVSQLREELENRMTEMRSQIQRFRTELTERDNILATRLRDTSRKREKQPTSAPQTAAPFYTALTDRFRGSTAEIRRRCQYYLPYVQSAPSITEATPLIDLGCGRGEWLSLLHERGIKAIGVDTNPTFVDRCRAAGLQVAEGDALKYLSTLPAAGVGAITAFHLFEHLSLDELLALMSEIIRVLRPGGFLLIETPNPENVLVSSNYFYLDPTHRHPIPPQLMHLIFEWHGLDRIETHYLHPWESAKFHSGGEAEARLNELLYGPMDYALIGWKV